jgi:hypothetical protein
MRKAARSLGGMASSNPRCWRGKRCHHHGGGVCWLFVLLRIDSCCHELIVCKNWYKNNPKEGLCGVTFWPTLACTTPSPCCHGEKTYSPVNIEGPEFADIPPPDLGAYRNVSKGWKFFLALLLLVIVPLSSSLSFSSPRRNYSAVNVIFVFVSRNCGCPCIASCLLQWRCRNGTEVIPEMA